MNGTPRNRIISDIALSLVFLTRLPLPHMDFSGRSLSSALWAAPVVGVVVALIGGIVFAVAAWLGLSLAPAAALALTATMLTTFCLHEDALGDTVDGFGGGSTREKKLEIMRDSRIGTYGAAALGLSILLRWTALADLTSVSQVFCALIAAHAASRGLIPAFMHFLPSARAEGLAANAGSPSYETAIAGAALGALTLLLLGMPGALATAIILGLWFFAFRKLCLAQIGGQTGDTIGALQQGAEIIVLLAASAIFV
ncbi:adenosylcobinamide-GDP ribazoletransferase [Mesorhizobium sp. DCY119]|uniref:adenosylcobinamide-GDP ribazoletransferase n=1 Tax=Mesorhizobium sp. DCY119 TaxID=2108445 RepID=UPI000E6BB612|nr:adenosylcobinamide-GDP ribazoletransferase [Mesorhizobium sp. DCY119]RJG44679.1 adenosylcobinamide-GDP ribazoletransferase [Mesorhizobium sp. DCY119]